jgi:hypothetical protein
MEQHIRAVGTAKKQYQIPQFVWIANLIGSVPNQENLLTSPVSICPVISNLAI